MRAAGIDLGTSRVGVAVTDELGLMAHPRPFLRARGDRRLVDALARLAAEEGVEVFVVGLPKTLGGVEGPLARRARALAGALAGRTGCRVELWDERMSTVEARARLREGGATERALRPRVDSAAAAVLLQAWLDGRAARRA